MLEAPQVVDVGSVMGGYTLMRELGKGGFGTVFLGEDPRGGLGAVKVMHAHHTHDDDFRERFAREIDLVRQVSSFCTARVLGADPHGSPPWVITEYVAGRTLARVIAEEGPYEESALYRLAVSTATALAAIHAVGVVHRDFKPENIMVAPDGARVIDFGIARALEGTRASASALIGTPRYMAPEQLEGEDVTTAIDLFAWGAVIVFAATGADAFAGPSQASVMRRVLMDEPDLEGVPESLRTVVSRCLAKDPAERPSSRALLGWLLGYEDLGGGAPHGTGAGGGAGEVTGTTEVLDHGAVLSHGEGVGTGRISLPPRGRGEPDTDASADPDAGAGDARGGAGVRSTPVPAADSGVRPFVFQGREYDDPFALAEAMQMDWGGARAVLESAPQRQALRRWQPADSPLRELLAEKPESPEHTEALVVWAIAYMGPELSPVYRELDMSFDNVVDGDGRLAPWVGRVEGLRAKIASGLLDPMSMHHCTDPGGHGCVPGRPCERYTEVADSVREVSEVVEAYRAWSVEASSLYTDDRLVFDIDVLEVLNEEAPDHRERTVEELVELATMKLPRGPTAVAVADAVQSAPEERRGLVAAVLAAGHAPLSRFKQARIDLRSLSGRAAQDERNQRSIRRINKEIAELEQKSAFGGASFVQIGIAAVCLLILAPASLDAEMAGLMVVCILAAVVLTVTSFVPTLNKSSEISELRERRSRLASVRAPADLPGFDASRHGPEEGLRVLEKAEARLPEVAAPGSPYMSEGPAR
ncbi:serine/threonine protein kinase [Nocardiopsis sp. HNM0947]|uniref:non-specific serine/threonine protein kinase n=1 Tax=Nocardiopsis coralli TaxID=2772213 RepID=A0ABR9PES0_9ACTN|nr:serine/threonine-protein kinase [Nocardiopsis coralli]MBE3002332.1 serine/threonine protein kinase [Nocardiopsis coralli]